MGKEINITQKLLRIVENRKTPVIINKQANSNKRTRKGIRSLAYESFSYNLDE